MIVSSQYTKTSDVAQSSLSAILRDLDRREVVGDFVECGVWAGGNLMIALTMSPHRTIWAYDTFDGMTQPGALDMRRNGIRALDKWKRRKTGWMAVSLDDVQKNISTEGFSCDGIRFVEGDVCKTLLDPANLPEKIACLRLDTDWYESTKVELEVLWPRVVPGGYLIVDDYGHWMGARAAVDRFFSPENRNANLKMADYTVAYMIKGS